MASRRMSDPRCRKVQPVKVTLLEEKKRSAAGVASCSECAAGRYSNTNRTVCVACAKGYISAAGASLCDSCPSGQHAQSLASTSCSDCPTGRASDSEATITCPACVQGKYANVTGADVCADCDATAGLYQDQASQIGCKTVVPCPAGERRYGSHAAYAGTCVQCIEGR